MPRLSNFVGRSSCLSFPKGLLTGSLRPAMRIGLAVMCLEIARTMVASLASANTPQSNLYRSSLLKSSTSGVDMAAL